MKFLWGFLVQQVLRQIKDIQNIDSFECTWKIFDISAIVILGYEHILLVQITFSIVTYNVNGMSLYNKSFGNQKISTTYWPFSWLGKYMTSPLHKPKS